MRYGSLAVDEIATETAPIAERIFAAGAVVHARTDHAGVLVHRLHALEALGRHAQPVEPRRRGRGSSGGSGASLAAGTSMLASGSDIGGSIRIPASINGVVGFKAPHGRVPTGAPYNLDRYCHDGVLARTIADCALFENVVAGPHPADIASPAAEARRSPIAWRASTGMRIALSVDLGSWEVDDEVAANTRAAGEALVEAGAKVDEVADPVEPRAADGHRSPAFRIDLRRRHRGRRGRVSRPGQRLRPRMGR